MLFANHIHDYYRQLSILSVVGLLLTGCATNSVSISGSDASMIKIESENQNSRVNILVIHHTTENFGESLRLLTKRTDYPVSSHYLIPEPYDGTYSENELRVHSLVSEQRRAWHAGQSEWRKKVMLNDQSIGIELVNQTKCFAHTNTSSYHDVNKRGLCFYPDFSERQISLLIDLSSNILKRHPDIRPTHIVGHSDIAPQRKVDPGPKFPWERLYKAGIGAWYDDEAVIRYWEQFQKTSPPLTIIQHALKIYGYKIEVTGVTDDQFKLVLRAFQLHFNSSEVTMAPDIRTLARLFALLEKYYPDELAKLCADNVCTTPLPTEI